MSSCGTRSAIHSSASYQDEDEDWQEVDGDDDDFSPASFAAPVLLAHPGTHHTLAEPVDHEQASIAGAPTVSRSHCRAKKQLPSAAATTQVPWPATRALGNTRKMSTSSPQAPRKTIVEGPRCSAYLAKQEQL